MDGQVDGYLRDAAQRIAILHLSAVLVRVLDGGGQKEHRSHVARSTNLALVRTRLHDRQDKS